MIQGLSAADERFLAALNQTQDRLSRAQQQISTGRKLNSASDAPDSISAVLAARANLSQTEQIGENLSRAKAEASTAEQSLENVVNILDRLSSIGLQGQTETQPASTRQGIAVEVGSLLTQLVNTSCTQVEGRFIFSGDTDNVAPYSIVDATPPATGTVVSDYAGSASSREIMHPNGTRFTIAHSAQDIFDASGASVFEAVTALRDALNAVPTVPSDDPDYANQYSAQTTAIGDALTTLKASREHVSQELAFYGVVQNRVAEAITFSSKLEVNQREQLSSVQDADIASAAVELTQAQTALQAALAARAKITNTSLFDYLK